MPVVVVISRDTKPRLPLLIMGLIKSLQYHIISLLDPLEMLGIILLTPVLLTLPFLPAIISSRDALSSGMFGLPLPFRGVPTSSKILLPLVDKVLDVLCEAGLQRVDIRVRSRVAAVHRHWKHAV
jgi:hypothetical protein